MLWKTLKRLSGDPSTTHNQDIIIVYESEVMSGVVNTEILIAKQPHGTVVEPHHTFNVLTISVVRPRLC